jgi:outer membrane protein OmpA-like peptidoglycan-associated protein
MAPVRIFPLLAAAFASAALTSLAGCKTQAKIEVAPPPPVPSSAPALPPRPPPEIKLDRSRIHISPELEFDPARPSLSHTRSTDAVLAALLETLKTHSEITKLRVEAHTDNVEGRADDAMTATEAQSKTLSQGRAEAVVAWLTSSGVVPGRLVAKGWGSSRPLVPNDSDEHRQNNRRIEFHVLETNGAPPPPEPLPTATATTSAPAAPPPKPSP